MKAKAAHPHLTDAELFGLALPPAGEPEALPAHLLECTACGRSLQTWKTAVRELSREDAGPMERRSQSEWREAEERTLAAIRGARVHRPFRFAWAATFAAALLVGALLLPWGREKPAPAAPAAPAVETAELSPADLADDTLLREASQLVRDDSQGAWEPFPAESTDAPRAEEKRL